MKPSYFQIYLTAFALISLLGCASQIPVIPVDNRTVNPGESITRGGSTTLSLLGKPINVGDQLPGVILVDNNLNYVDLSSYVGDVLLISIVPSIDTQVCERQTHILGEEAETLPRSIRLITISRDLPFAQNRFREETGFGDILFLSDYQKADFGQSTGLLVDQIYLLARAVMVVDQQGVVRYLQVVPEISHLPNMRQAFQAAEALLNSP